MQAEPKIKLQHAATEIEETIQAIRSGQVDALVIETSSGDQVFTIEKSSDPFQSVDELREVLQAIRNGQVDALVVTTPLGDRVFALEGADQPYRIFMETMREGAASLDEEGTVLYANARFAEIIGVPLEKFIGVSLYSHAEPQEQEKLRRLVDEGPKNRATAEVIFKTSRGRSRLRLSFSAFPTQENEPKSHAMCVVATDVTELFEVNESLRKKEGALKELSARLLRSQDEERGRLGRELHDSLGQLLAGLKIQLSALEREGSRKNPDEVFAECNRTVDLVIREVRTMSYLLYPPMLEEMGLRTAIEWYLEGFRQRSGILVDFEAAKDFSRLLPDTELALFRVLQESMTNVLRHSGSRTAQIRLREEDKMVVLEIQDQGRGAPGAAIEVSDDSIGILGVGLRGMNERLRQIGGTLELFSSETGTLIRATVPLGTHRNPVPAAGA